MEQSTYGICEESGLELNTNEHWEWWLREKCGLTRQGHDENICENHRCELDIEYRMNYLGETMEMIIEQSNQRLAELRAEAAQR